MVSRAPSPRPAAVARTSRASCAGQSFPPDCSTMRLTNVSSFGPFRLLIAAAVTNGSLDWLIRSNSRAPALLSFHSPMEYAS